MLAAAWRMDWTRAEMEPGRPASDFCWNPGGNRWWSQQRWQPQRWSPLDLPIGAAGRADGLEVAKRGRTKGESGYLLWAATEREGLCSGGTWKGEHEAEKWRGQAVPCCVCMLCLNRWWTHLDGYDGLMRDPSWAVNWGIVLMCVRDATGAVQLLGH